MTKFKKHSMLTVGLIVLIMMLLVPQTHVSAKEQDYGTGYLEPDKNLYYVPSVKKELRKSRSHLPERYDSRQQPWFSQIKVKNQKNLGICWACATVTASEISYAKETYGTGIEVPEMSPGHLAYFITHRCPDPLGLTNDDAGLDMSPWGGGDFDYAMMHLSTWCGMGLESNTPLEAVSAYTAAGGDSDLFTYDDSYAYDDFAIIQNCYSHRDADIDTIKQMIYEFGATATSMCFKSRYFANGSSTNSDAFYDPDDKSVNHAATIIGWDDTYSRDNFASYDKETNTFTAKPEKDGAWIVQNSHGTECQNGGYFYISYESADVIHGQKIAMDMQVPNAYDYNYQYDGNVAIAYSGDDTWKVGIETERGNKAANVFQAQTGISLRAIGLTGFTDGYAAYTAEVYTGLSDPTDPLSGTLGCSFSFTTDSAGFKTIELPEPVYVSAGDSYSIVITIDSEYSALGREELIWNEDHSWNNGADIDPGQSFLYDASTGVWQDLYEYDTCFRIKGFADQAYEVQFTLGDYYAGNDYIICKRYVKEHEAAIPPEDPTLKGFMFNGWNQSFNDVTSDMVIDATWLWDLSVRPVSLSSTQFVYNGKVRKPTIDCFDGTVLEEGIDYTAVWSNPLSKNVGTYTITITGKGEWAGTVKAKYKIVKAPNPMIARNKTVKLSKAKVAKKAQTITAKKAFGVKKAKGTVTYKKTKGNSKITVSSKGKVTVKKGLKKGTYKVTVRIKAAGTSNYKATTWRVTLTVKI